MADPSSGTGNDNPVIVDPTAIATHGQTLEDLAGRLRGLELLSNVKISAGSFPTANMFMNKFNTNTHILSTGITGSADYFDQTGEKMITLSTVYKNAGDLNKDDADRLSGVVGVAQDSYSDKGSSPGSDGSTPSVPGPTADGDAADDNTKTPRPWHSGPPDAANGDGTDPVPAEPDKPPIPDPPPEYDPIPVIP
jgi:hypothetical protein